MTTITRRLPARAAALKAARAPMSALDKSLANQWEAGLDVRTNGARTKEKLKALLSKKTYEAPRRDEVEDRDIFEEIQRSLRSGHAVHLTSRSPTPVKGGETSKKSNKLLSEASKIKIAERDRLKSNGQLPIIRRRLPVHIEEWQSIATVDRARRKRGEVAKVMWVPHWDRTGPKLKGLAWGMALYERQAMTMSLNLSDGVIAAATKDQKGFSRHLRERIKRELSKTFEPLGVESPEFFIVVEASELGRPHLHGGILLPDHPQAEKLARDALYFATNGRQTGERRSGREVHLTPLATPALWVDYVTKWLAGSEGRMESGVISATSGLRAMGKTWYNLRRSDEACLSGHELDDSFIKL